jgi:hypothetical protein
MPPNKPHGTPELLAAVRASGIDPDADEWDQGEFEAVENGEEPEEPFGSEQPEDSGDEALEEFPENWFGHNIREYAEEYGVEAAKAHFEALQDSNRAASRRIQELAESRKQAHERQTQERFQIQETPEPVELTDEEALEAMGISPQLLEYEDMGKPVAQLAKVALELNNKLEETNRALQSSQWEQEFWGTFNELQSAEGQVPYAREDIEAFAAERGLFDAEALYWMLAGPVARRAGTGSQPKPKAPANRQQREMRGLKKGISTKGRGASRQGATAPGKPKSMREAYEIALKQKNLTDFEAIQD